MQACGRGQVGDNKGHNQKIDDNFIYNIRNYISIVKFLPGASADIITVDGRSENTQVAELFERISEITREDMLQERISGRPQEGTLPGRASPLSEGEPLKAIPE